MKCNHPAALAILSTDFSLDSVVAHFKERGVSFSLRKQNFTAKSLRARVLRTVKSLKWKSLCNKIPLARSVGSQAALNIISGQNNN
jgi:hypothetical protein